VRPRLRDTPNMGAAADLKKLRNLVGPVFGQQPF
jgi:hypothetical protein